jgi:oligopeptide transport system permease protein
LLVIITITFMMTRVLPGDPFSNEKISAEAHNRILAKYGLDKPMTEQYVNYMRGLLRGDLQLSYRHPGWTVSEVIGDRIPTSLELGFYALLIALFIGITTGVIASIRPNTWLDYIPMSSAMIGICLPTFVIGPIMILVFGLKLEWFPIWGWVEPINKILPSFTLGIFYTAYIARLMRGSMMEVRNQDYIRTARAKGLSNIKIYLVHCFRNALSPVVSFMGPTAAGLLSGSFVIETIFQIPGLGRLFVDSAINSDNNMLLGLVIFYAVLIIIFNLIVDILQVFLNPKREYE